MQTLTGLDAATFKILSFQQDVLENVNTRIDHSSSRNKSFLVIYSLQSRSLTDLGNVRNTTTHSDLCARCKIYIYTEDIK